MAIHDNNMIYISSRRACVGAGKHQTKVAPLRNISSLQRFISECVSFKCTTLILSFFSSGYYPPTPALYGPNSCLPLIRVQRKQQQTYFLVTRCTERQNKCSLIKCYVNVNVQACLSDSVITYVHRYLSDVGLCKCVHLLNISNE